MSDFCLLACLSVRTSVRPLDILSKYLPAFPPRISSTYFVYESRLRISSTYLDVSPQRLSSKCFLYVFPLRNASTYFQQVFYTLLNDHILHFTTTLYCPFSFPQMLIPPGKHRQALSVHTLWNTPC